ncbi:MAG: cytochrome P450 [Myxococcales bacterium]|nr:cytochrome P450 [Myxococcales bacterium]MCB9536950.1 cytochrome P450 [Myxococcales bacterium]
MSVHVDTSIAPNLDRAPLVSGGTFVWGHAAEMGRDPLGLLVRASAEAGPIARLRFGPVETLSLTDPAAIERVLVGNASAYGKSTRSYRLIQLLLGDGLVTSQGEHWLRQRRIAQPAFLRKRIAALGERMVTASVDLTRAWAGPATRGETIDVHAEMNHLALRIAGETLFSTDVTGEAAAIGDALKVGMAEIDRLIMAPLPAPQYWPSLGNLRFWRSARTLRRVTDDLIGARRAEGGDHDDLLGLLMAARDPETGEGMSDQQLRDETLTMLLAGHETTANGLTWSLHLLGLHPAIRRRLQAELDAVLGDRAPTPDDHRALPYTRQVVQEALRLYPPVWIVERMAEADDVLGGYRVKKGTMVLMSQWAVHRSPRLWTNPEAFDPDRFGPDRPAPGRFAYFPFSRGQRQCIGDRFAELEMVLVLATLLQRYTLDPVPGAAPALAPQITLRPVDGLRMTLRPRAAD